MIEIEERDGQNISEKHIKRKKKKYTLDGSITTENEKPPIKKKIAKKYNCSRIINHQERMG